MNHRRTFLKGVSLGAGSMLFEPLLQKVAAQAAGRPTAPKRVIFLLFDNTLLVFMSDSANQQHSWPGANWPFVLVGNLGGTLRTGQFVSYPVNAQAAGGDGGNQTFGTATERIQ